MMGQHEAVEPAPEVLDAGQPTPPTTSAKANAAVLYALLPILLGSVLEVLNQYVTLFPDAPSWIAPWVSVVLLFLSPVAAYFGVKRTPNLLLQPVQVLKN
jgi:hypothetical protein